MTEDQLRRAMDQSYEFRARKEAFSMADKVASDVSTSLGKLLKKWAYHGVTREEMKARLYLAINTLDPLD